jgi:hypothetical protein
VPTLQMSASMRRNKDGYAPEIEMTDEPINQIAIIPVPPCTTCKRNIGDYGGMCDGCILKKHIALRGSAALLYTRGTAAATCQMQCGCGAKHDCFIRLGHTSGHVFSSECKDGQQ